MLPCAAVAGAADWGCCPGGAGWAPGCTGGDVPAENAVSVDCPGAEEPEGWEDAGVPNVGCAGTLGGEMIAGADAWPAGGWGCCGEIVADAIAWAGGEDGFFPNRVAKSGFFWGGSRIWLAGGIGDCGEGWGVWMVGGACAGCA